MGGRHKRSVRCLRCRMHPDVCVCWAIPSLEVRTRVVLVMHHREAKKVTNTGVLALSALPSASIHLWGRRGGADAPPLALPPGPAAVLTPSEDAAVLTPEMFPTPVTLVVPDGTWRQAMKIPRRVPALAALPRVVLPPGPPTRYHLREDPRPHGLATLEAIARALGILEGAERGHEVQASLERLFHAMVEATLMTRGRLPRSDTDRG